MEYGVISKEIIEEIILKLKNEIISTDLFLGEYDVFSNSKHLKFIENQLKAKGNSFFVSVKDAHKNEAWAIISLNKFDTSIFGFSVVNIDHIFISNNFDSGFVLLFEKIKLFFRKEQIKYATLSVNTNYNLCSNLVNDSIKNGFYYLNTLVVFGVTKRNFNQLDLRSEAKEGIVIRNSVSSDFESLSLIAQESFKLDKYHLDSNLSNEKCDLLHYESFKNSFYNGFVDQILVAEYNNIPVGYCSIKIRKIDEYEIDYGIPVIAAVNENYRGLGIYQSLEKERTIRLNELAEISEYGTYINNIPIHSVFTKRKMKLIKGIIQLAYFEKSC